MLSRQFFARSVHEVAPELIGVTLLVDGVGGPIVEVEAYDSAVDPGGARLPRAHAERTRRCSARPGHALRLPLVRHPLVPEPRLRGGGIAAAVLIRALEPTHGVEVMRAAARSRRTRGCSRRSRPALPRRSASRASTTGCALDEPPFELSRG